jgi:hypothetical protein
MVRGGDDTGLRVGLDEAAGQFGPRGVAVLSEVVEDEPTGVVRQCFKTVLVGVGRNGDSIATHNHI